MAPGVRVLRDAVRSALTPPAAAQVFLSVVVRTKDRPALLRRALASIGAQTWGDLEIVVVNDGGDPEEVLAALEVLDTRRRAATRVINHSPSLGRAEAANAGIAAAVGAFVVLHDDDDTWEPELVERVAEYLSTRPRADGVVVRCGVVREEITPDGIREISRETLASTTTHVSLGEQLMRNTAPPISYIYRRSLHDVVGWYDGDLEQLEDWDLSIRLLAAGAEIGFLEQGPLAWWHLRASGAPNEQSVSLSSEPARVRSTERIRDKHLRAGTGSGAVGAAVHMSRLAEQLLDGQQALERHLGLVGSHLAGLITAQAARIEALENELRELRLTHEGPVTSPESDVTGPGEAAAPTDEPAAPADG